MGKLVVYTRQHLLVDYVNYSNGNVSLQDRRQIRLSVMLLGYAVAFAPHL